MIFLPEKIIFISIRIVNYSFEKSEKFFKMMHCYLKTNES